MDELSAFRFAPPQLLERERELLEEADLVFTGGKVCLRQNAGATGRYIVFLQAWIMRILRPHALKLLDLLTKTISPILGLAILV